MKAILFAAGKAQGLGVSQERPKAIDVGGVAMLDHWSRNYMR